MRVKIYGLIITCVVILVASACSTNDSSINNEGKFLGVVEDNGYDLDSDYGVLPKGFCIDEHLALEIGNAVIKTVASKWDSNVLSNTEFIVYEIKDRDVFVVCRWYPDRQGGDYNVALSKNNGAIIKFWNGE